MSTLAADPLWFATRAFGTVTLVLLTATVVIGVVSAGRHSPGTLARFEVAALHRNISVLSLISLVIHVLAALADTYVPLGWISALVPFLSPYRTLWVGLGTVAFDLLLAVALTSAVRQRLGVRRWKAVHLLAYAAWPLALFHGAGTGTDTRLSVQLLLYAACVGAVVAAAWWRLYRAGPAHRAARSWGALAAAALPIVLAVFLTSGPLAPHWSQRAQGHAPAAPAATHTTLAPDQGSRS